MPGSIDSSEPAEKRPQRDRNLSKRFQDYQLDLQDIVLIAALFISVTKSYWEALEIDPSWRDGITEELNAHSKNGTREYIPREKDMEDSKWVFSEIEIN